MTGMVRVAGPALALGLALGILGSVVVFVAIPIHGEIERLDADIALARGLGERLTARTAHREVHVERIAELEAALRESDHAIRAGTDALAAAEIQRRLDAVAARNEIRLLSVQNLPSEVDQGFVRVVLSARLAGSIDGLRGLLHELESARPWLFVDDLQIRADPSPGAGTGADARPPLSIAFQISGYMTPEPGS